MMAGCGYARRFNKARETGMSMLDVAKYLSYSRSIDHSKDSERIFNLKLANSGRLFSCLHSDRKHWSFGRQQNQWEHASKTGKEV